MLTRKRFPDGSRLLTSKDGACQIHHFGKGVVLHTCKGVIDAEFAPEVIADGEQQLTEHGRCVYMVDCFDSPKMTGEFRDRVLEWTLSNEERVDAHLLVSSPITRMALQTIILFLRRRKFVHVYSSVNAWVDAGREQSSFMFCRKPIRFPAEVASL